MNGGGWRFFGQQRHNNVARKHRRRAGTAYLRSEVSDMSIYDEYRIVINEAQRRLIMRALTNTMANDRRSTDALSPTAGEWMHLIRLFSTIEPSVRKAAQRRRQKTA